MSVTYHLVFLFGMAQSSKTTKTPRESSLLAIDSYSVIHTTTEIDNFSDIYRRNVPVFAFFDVQNDTFWTRLEIETKLGAGFEVFTIGVVT